MQSKKILQKVSRDFARDTFLLPKIGAELEFYFYGKSIADIQQILASKLVKFDKIVTEEGEGQFEVIFPPFEDVVALCDNIVAARMALEVLGANFKAKPFTDQPSSGMHIHLSLYNRDKANVFVNQNGDTESEYLKIALAGLVHFMAASTRYFMPESEDYLRFNDKHFVGKYIAWGGNNRTVVLRVPTTTFEPQNKRIEHRLASSSADPYLVVSCMLVSISYALQNKLQLELPKIHGNAFDSQYSLQELPSNLREALLIKDDYLDKKIGVFN